jgi:hypothetical protein
MNSAGLTVNKQFINELKMLWPKNWVYK